MIQTLKILECYADAVASGEKTFEIRDNSDRGFQKGDIVCFEVIDKYNIKIDHPLNNLDYEITYVLSGWGLKEGFVVFGIKMLQGNISFDKEQK